MLTSTKMPNLNPSRRAVLAGLAGLQLPLAAAGVSPSRVIDVATHFFDTRRPQGVPWPAANDPILYKPSLPDRYLQAIAPTRVDGVVAIEASPWLEDNLWLLNVADHEALIQAVVGNLSPGHVDFRAALERFAKHPLFRGIRVGGGGLAGMLSDRAKSADLELLAARGLSLDVLVTNPSHFAPVVELARRLPSLRMILGHLPLDDTTGMSALAEHREIFVKVSGVVRKVRGKVPTEFAYYKPQLDELWKVFGPQRLLFASNWPTCDLIAPWPTVYGIVAEYMGRRTQAEAESFFWQNAVKAYRLAV
ncbi:MAG: amidohydrolase 2 [Bryobacterales bacterium]|jgi:L-fuconolactonase|nr:amidohydrolase 2 [Bryobacterales bacterium]